MEEKVINEAIEMTKGVPWKDVLVPLAQEEKEICPYPQVEYTIVEAPTMDKLVRDVNTHLANGRVCDGGVQVSGWPIARFYQSMERRNVDCRPEQDDCVGGLEWIKWTKPEMPSEIFKAGGQGLEPLHMPGLEDEEDLYEDIEKEWN